MFKIKFPTKRIFRTFPILRINGMVPFCNLFMKRPSYTNQPAYIHSLLKHYVPSHILRVHQKLICHLSVVSRACFASHNFAVTLPPFRTSSLCAFTILFLYAVPVANSKHFSTTLLIGHFSLPLYSLHPRSSGFPVDIVRHTNLLTYLQHAHMTYHDKSFNLKSSKIEHI